MQKLKLKILDKMILNKCTSAEIDFILHISHYQDDSGKVHGVYYKDICTALDISYQKFYDIKAALIQKNIISAGKECYSDWNVKILDNDFSYPESFKEGYIDTSHKIFEDEEFFALKAGEKLLAMLFMKISFAGRGCYNIGVDKFFEKYEDLFGMTKRAIQNYMTSLRKFFSIGVKERQYWITPLSRIYKKKTISSPTDGSIYREHVADIIFRRKKIKLNKNTYQDAVTLLKQYGERLKDKAVELFQKAVDLSVQKTNEGIKNKRKWERKLQPKLLHLMLKEQMSALGI